MPFYYALSRREFFGLRRLCWSGWTSHTGPESSGILVDAARGVNDLNTIPSPYLDTEFARYWTGSKSVAQDVDIRYKSHRRRGRASDGAATKGSKDTDGFVLSETVCSSQTERTVCERCLLAVWRSIRAI